MRSRAGAVLALALAVACSAAPPPEATLPAIPAAARPLLALLEARDRAQAAGDEAAALALVAADAPVPFRDREAALARANGQRRHTPPQRTLLALNVAGPDATLEVAEADDQGRERRVRYVFNGLPDAPRLTEPLAFGPERTLDFAGGTIRYRAFEEDQAALLARLAPAAVTALVARLGDAYAPRTPLQLVLRPDVVGGLPPFASGSVADGVVTFHTSASLLAETGPGSAWTRTLVTHELAHVLLFQRGSGSFLLSEGLPLWLTDDRRAPELERLVAANALWTLEHLLDGPRQPSEFFAGYAQASSFVRFLAERHGDRALLAVWEAGRRTPFTEAFRSATGADAPAAHAAWRASLGR